MIIKKRRKNTSTSQKRRLTSTKNTKDMNNDNNVQLHVYAANEQAVDIMLGW